MNDKSPAQQMHKVERSQLTDSTQMVHQRELDLKIPPLAPQELPHQNRKNDNKSNSKLQKPI
jgi:hypothetical protein